MSISLTLRSTRGYVSVVYSCFETKVLESFYLLLLKDNTPSDQFEIYVDIIFVEKNKKGNIEDGRQR